MRQEAVPSSALLAAIRRRQLATLVLLWVAAHRPLAFLAGQTLYTAAPLAALLGWERAEQWAEHLSRPGAGPRLEAALAAAPPDKPDEIDAHGLE
jgi:hypothetical protein